MLEMSDHTQNRTEIYKKIEHKSIKNSQTDITRESYGLNYSSSNASVAMFCRYTHVLCFIDTYDTICKFSALLLLHYLPKYIQLGISTLTVVKKHEEFERNQL